MNKYKPGDRVYSFIYKLSGTIRESVPYGGVAAYRIDWDDGFPWTNHESTFVLETVYNSPLYQALK